MILQRLFYFKLEFGRFGVGCLNEITLKQKHVWPAYWFREKRWPFHWGKSILTLRLVDILSTIDCTRIYERVKIIRHSVFSILMRVCSRGHIDNFSFRRVNQHQLFKALCCRPSHDVWHWVSVRSNVFVSDIKRKRT